MGAVEFWSNVISAWAWPVAVVALVFLLRSQIASWMGTILGKHSGSIRLGPAETNWSGKEQAALSDAGQQLVESNVNQALSTELEGKPWAVEVDLTELLAGIQQRQAEEEERRKDSVEAVIEAAANWGWVQHASGTSSAFPVPIVEWDENDRPYIVGSKVVNIGDTILDIRPGRRARSRTYWGENRPGPLDPPTAPATDPEDDSGAT